VDSAVAPVDGVSMSSRAFIEFIFADAAALSRTQEMSFVCLRARFVVQLNRQPSVKLHATRNLRKPADARIRCTPISDLEGLKYDSRMPVPAEWYRWAVQSIRGYALFTTDLDARIVTWDQGAVDLFGYRREDVLGEDARLIFTPEDIRKRAPEMELEAAMAKRTALDERWHVRKDASLFWANGLMMLLTDDTGRSVGFLKLIRERPPPG
jgi:PAS domain S-box-containing protein